MEGRDGSISSGGGGLIVRGVDSPSNFHVVARNENPNNNVGSTGKKKRGRPRKYGPDGAVSLPLSPIPMPWPTTTTSSSGGGGGDFPVKWGRGWAAMHQPKPNSKIEMVNLAELVPSSVGTNFTPHVITVAAGEVDDTNAEQGGEIHPNHMGVDTGRGGGADREMAPPDHEYNRLQVSISVAEGVETGASAPVAHPNAGALFGRHFKAPLNGNEMVGGFSVPSDHVALYTQVWQKYGHIATTKKGTHCPTLAGIVASVLSIIAEMNNETLATVTGDLLEDWEALLLMSEGLEFDLAWLRQQIDSIKEAQADMDMIRQEEEAVAAETERIQMLTQDVKVRNDALNKMKEVFSKPLLDGAL